MEKKKKDRDPIADQQIYEQFYNLNSVASSSELTGLTPTPPITDASAESYAEIYSMPVPEGTGGGYEEGTKDKGRG